MGITSASTVGSIVPDPEHPSDDLLAAYLSGDLSSDGFAKVDRHLDDCEACGNRLIEITEENVPRNGFLIEPGTVQGLTDACRRMIRKAERLSGTAPREGDGPPVDPNASTIAEHTERAELDSEFVRSASYAEGDVFGDYEIVREIARGGMGVVYLARQASLNREVAIKMILDSRLASDEAVRRFRAEAESAARLDHPGIVPVFEVGHVGGQQYFAMGFVDGRSLRQVLDDEGRFDSRRAAEVLAAIARTVQYAHTRNIVHRDLKPGNVLIDEAGSPKLTDFGLAKDFERGQHLTSDGQVLGTPHYMAPEQAAGRLEEVGPLSDVYSLGAILYHLISSRPPFHEASVLRTLNAVVEDEPESPRRWNPNVDADLSTICLKCLEKDPARRFNSAGDVADELDRYLAGEPIESRSISVTERVVRWFRRNPRVFWGMVAPIIVITGAVAYAAFGLERVASSLESQLEVTATNGLRSSAGWVAEAVERELSAKYRQTQIAADQLQEDLGTVVEDHTEYENAKRELEKWHRDAKRADEEGRPRPPYPDHFAKIQQWVDADPDTIGPRLWNYAEPEVSYNVLAWWVCGPDGCQIARNPLVPVEHLDFAYRSYFTGALGDAERGTAPPPAWKSGGPRLSAPFLTEETNRWVVAISAPVFRNRSDDGDRDATPELVGVVGMFVEVGALLQSDAESGDDTGRVAILLDDRHGDDGARIIEHPYFDDPAARRELAKDVNDVARSTIARSDWEGTPVDDPFAAGRFENTEAFRGSWRSSHAVVDLPGDDGELIAIVREPEEVIADPGRRLRVNLRSLGLAVVGLFLIPPLVALLLAMQRRRSR